MAGWRVSKGESKDIPWKWLNDLGCECDGERALQRGVVWWEESLSCYPSSLVLVGIQTSSKVHIFDDLMMLKHVETTQQPNGTL